MQSQDPVQCDKVTQPAIRSCFRCVSCRSQGRPEAMLQKHSDTSENRAVTLKVVRSAMGGKSRHDTKETPCIARITPEHAVAVTCMNGSELFLVFGFSVALGSITVLPPGRPSLTVSGSLPKCSASREIKSKEAWRGNWPFEPKPSISGFRNAFSFQKWACIIRVRAQECLPELCPPN